MEIINPVDNKFLDQMVDCQLKMAKESEGFELNPDVLRQGIETVIYNSAKGKYFLAVEDSNVLGMLLTIPEWSDWRCKEVMWIHSVYVLPEQRGKKIYSKLYSHLKQIVEEDEAYAGLRLYVDKSNKSAIKVYEKLQMSNEHYDLFEWLK